MKRLARSLILLASPCLAPASDQLPATPANAEIDQRILDQIAAPITSRAALDDYLDKMPTQSPLLALSEEARAEFLASLVFTEHGLASYRYLPLQKIEMAEAYRILALFGVQSSLAVAPGMRATSVDSQRVKAALRPEP